MTTPGDVRLNLTQLATLREFARSGTLAAAAAQLGYTPGAVSQHVASLERALSTTLVRRTGRRLELTDAGRLLVEYAETLLETEARAVQDVRSVDERVAGPLLVGTWGSTAAALLAPVVERMGATYPEVRLRSREVDVDDAATAVRRGRVDVAFGLDYADAPMPRDRDIAVVELHQEEFVVAMSAGAGPSHGPVDLATLETLSWILPPATSQYGRAIRAGCRRRGFEPRVVHEVTDTAAALQLAAAGLGATTMTPLMSRMNPDLDLRRLTMADPMTRQIVLITRAGGLRRPVRVFVETVREVMAGLS